MATTARQGTTSAVGESQRGNYGGVTRILVALGRWLPRERACARCGRTFLASDLELERPFTDAVSACPVCGTRGGFRWS